MLTIVMGGKRVTVGVVVVARRWRHYERVMDELRCFVGSMRSIRFDSSK